MKALGKSSLSLAAGMIVLAMCATGAQASPVEPTPADDTFVINGQEYGPEDGVTITEESFEITPGQGTVGRIFTTPVAPGTIQPLAAWGASYATSTETAQLKYTGRAKAAGNVYGSKRIVGVCFHYSRGGKAVNSEKCSSATYVSGSWRAGSEVSDSVWDSLNPIASKTVFNMRLVQVAPGATL